MANDRIAVAASVPPKARKRRTIVLALATATLAALGVGAFRIAPSLVDGDEYAAVASIEGASTFRDEKLMRVAWQLPVARRYQSTGFEYQANPSFCGPASVSNVLRSIGIATSQNEVIDDTPYDPWFGVLVGGLTLEEVAEILRVRTNGRVEIIRDMDVAQFRDHMRRANDPAHRYIVNFHRGPLFARGHGHFSPVLGYLEAEDLVLVGDTNREYRPFLVKTERLWQGTDTIDSDGGKERGLLRLDLP